MVAAPLRRLMRRATARAGSRLVICTHRRGPPFGSRVSPLTPMAAISPRTRLIGATAALAAGIVTAFMIQVYPEGLRVPAWVAYAAASAFALAGLCLLAAAAGVSWLERWLGIAVTLSLFTVSSWVAFGPGERECSMLIPFLQTVAHDVLCRGVFAFGSLLIGLSLCLFVYRAMRSNPET